MASDSRIRANSVLPAVREPLRLTTSDGLQLVGELAAPVDGNAAATLICVHPLPTAGGMMDSQIFRKAAYRLPALAATAVLRFNTRGTASAQGTSEGTFDSGVAERHDVAAAVGAAVTAGLPNRWLLGWSFGTELILKYAGTADVSGAILLSPPLRLAERSDLLAWAVSGKPLVAVVPEYDDYLRPPEARERFAVVPQASVVAVRDGKHLWVGQAETVLDIIVGVVNPAAAPLPRSRHGDMVLSTPTIIAPS